MYSIMKETSKIKEPGHGSETVLLDYSVNIMWELVRNDVCLTPNQVN